MRQAALPLAYVQFIVVEPVESAVSIFDSVLKCPDKDISICLQLVPQSTALPVVIDALEDIAIGQNRNSQSIECGLFWLVFVIDIF